MKRYVFAVGFVVVAATAACDVEHPDDETFEADVDAGFDSQATPPPPVGGPAPAPHCSFKDRWDDAGRIVLECADDNNKLVCEATWDPISCRYVNVWCCDPWADTDPEEVEQPWPF